MVRLLTTWYKQLMPTRHAKIDMEVRATKAQCQALTEAGQPPSAPEQQEEEDGWMAMAEEVEEQRMEEEEPMTIDATLAYVFTMLQAE